MCPGCLFSHSIHDPLGTFLTGWCTGLWSESSFMIPEAWGDEHRICVDLTAPCRCFEWNSEKLHSSYLPVCTICCDAWICGRSVWLTWCRFCCLRLLKVLGTVDFRSHASCFYSFGWVHFFSRYLSDRFLSHLIYRGVLSEDSRDPWEDDRIPLRPIFVHIPRIPTKCMASIVLSLSIHV